MDTAVPPASSPRLCLGHERAQRLEMGGAALHVDVGAVEVLVDRNHLGTQTAQRLGAGHAGCAMACVERHLETREVDALAGHRGHGVRDVQLAGIVHRQRHAHFVAVVNARYARPAK